MILDYEHMMKFMNYDLWIYKEMQAFMKLM